MITINKLCLIALLPCALLLSACNNSTGGASADADPVSSREDIMKNWQDAMGIMKGMVEKPETFNAAQFQEQAAFLAKDAGSPWVYFADKAHMGEAKEAVWSNPEGFKAEAEKFQQVTAALDTAAKSASKVEDVQAAFMAVGGSCKSCHTAYKAD